MKAQLKIVEKDGFISSINGVEQVPAENKYWLFDVNGTMSPVGAKEVILNAGDVIDWKLNKLQIVLWQIQLEKSPLSPYYPLFA